MYKTTRHTMLQMGNEIEHLLMEKLGRKRGNAPGYNNNCQFGA